MPEINKYNLKMKKSTTHHGMRVDGDLKRNESFQRKVKYKPDFESALAEEEEEREALRKEEDGIS